MAEPTSSTAPQPGHEHEPHGSNGLFFDARGIRPVWALLLYMAIVLTPRTMLSVASRVANGDQVPGTQVLHLGPLVAAFSEWLPFGLVFFATWIMSRIEDRSVLDYGLAVKGRHPASRLTIGTAWGAACMSLLIALLWVTHHLAFDGVLVHGSAAVAYGLAWAFVFLGVGLFEETLFRGYMQFTLARCIADLIHWASPAYRKASSAGFWVAAVLISFGFGLVHAGNAGETPLGLLCAGMAGLVFAFSLWRTGSLWWAIGFHAAWDWAQSFLFGVADSGTISTGHLLASRPVGPALLSGGSTGPEGSIFALLVVLLIAVIIAVTLRRDAGSLDERVLEAHRPAAYALAEVNSRRA